MRYGSSTSSSVFFFQAEDGIRVPLVTGVQTCALPISRYRKCAQCNAKNLGWIGSLLNLASTFPRRWLCRHAEGNIAVSNHVATRIALPRTRTIYHGIHDTCNTYPTP